MSGFWNSIDLQSEQSDGSSVASNPPSNTPSPSRSLLYEPDIAEYDLDLPDYESESSEDTIRIINNVSDLDEAETREWRSLRDDLEEVEIRERSTLHREDTGLEEEEAEHQPQDMGTYVPDPKFTFLFDPGRHHPHHQHTCSICMISPLRILPATQRQSIYNQNNDSVPCVLPCGHIFGQACIRQWMQDHDQCPVCRTPMVHELCKHKIRLRPLWKETIWLVPRTIPDGGKIAAFCSTCEAVERRAVINGLMETLGRLYYDAKLRWKRTGREKDRVQMVKYRVRMDDDLKRLVTRETVGEWY
ncbi:hypothetical protein QC762_304735 [Podospora pseudocomata]|uniref:RING-type domain-containing protein n=1 Tax=Podospora pseudocomata TaxID=2093779 RepID=A0ABR0GJ53_9PEZI|nr:hypothetical protein QC762_304735 [Podospora pseudocomata]